MTGSDVVLEAIPILLLLGLLVVLALLLLSIS